MYAGKRELFEGLWIEDQWDLAPYADLPKEKIAVGVNFSSEERQVVEWKAEG